MTHICHAENVYAMRVFIVLLVLIFGLQSLSKAEDISEFQIEGISIGDSLLNYFTEEEIKERIQRDFPGSDKYKRFWLKKNELSSFSFKTYDAIQTVFKKNDKNFKVAGIAGELLITDINDCYKKQKIITEEISRIFPDAEVFTETVKARADKSGKSIKKIVEYRMSYGEAQVTCSDWSYEMNIDDDLSVILWTINFGKFLSNEAYD